MCPVSRGVPSRMLLIVPRCDDVLKAGNQKRTPQLLDLTMSGRPTF